MTIVLQNLMSALDPPVDDSVLQCESDGCLRFLYDRQFIVNVIDDSASGDIRLIAMTQSDAEDSALAGEPIEPAQWNLVRSIESEFFCSVLLHEATGVLSLVSAASRASLDNLRFKAWLESFLSAAVDNLKLASEFRVDASLESTPASGNDFGLGELSRQGIFLA